MNCHSDKSIKIASFSEKIEVKDIKSKRDRTEKDNDAKNADKADSEKYNWQRSMGYQQSKSSNALKSAKKIMPSMNNKNNVFDENICEDEYKINKHMEKLLKLKIDSFIWLHVNSQSLLQ